MKKLEKTIKLRISKEKYSFLKKLADDMQTDNMSEVVRRIIDSYYMLVTVLYGAFPNREKKEVEEVIKRDLDKV